MKKARIELTSTTPYSQSRAHFTAKLEKESPADYEDRTWMEKGHYNEAGHLYIPPMALASSIKEASKYISIKIKGKGNETYTKNFEAGIMIQDSIETRYTRETVRKNWVYCHANGKKGSGTRVRRAFPTADDWSGEVDLIILDDIITQEVLEQVISTAGLLIGIGQFRPRNGGYYGRYKAVVKSFKDKVTI